MTLALGRWGLWGITAMYVLEGMGLPWPIEIPLWLSGQMLQQGVIVYWQMVSLTWLGTSLGNMVAFAVARLGGRPLAMAISDRLHMQDRVRRVQGWIDRYGLGAAVVTRWVNWGFGLSLWVTGFSEIPSGRSIAVMLMNNALWASAWTKLGWTVVGALRLAGLPGWLVLVPGAVLLAVWGTWRLCRKHKRGEDR